MSLSKTVYRAERMNTETDGKHVLITRQLEGPHDYLRGDLPKHVARLSDEQAEKLRDELDEVLDA